TPSLRFVSPASVKVYWRQNRTPEPGHTSIAEDDGVVHRAAGVVVICSTCEAPGVAGVIGGICVSGVSRVDRAHGRSRLPVHTGDGGDRRRMRLAVIGDVGV